MTASSKSKLSAETRKAIADAIKADEFLDANTLASIVNKDAKTLRAHMRKSAYRDQSSEKNNRWRITQEQALSVAEHYASKSASKEQAS